MKCVPYHRVSSKIQVEEIELPKVDYIDAPKPNSKPQGSGKSQPIMSHEQEMEELTKKRISKESDNSRKTQSAKNHKFDVNCDCKSCMDKLTKKM